MKIKFWGVRGSIATPGRETIRYGGDTTCIEVRVYGELIIAEARGRTGFTVRRCRLSHENV